jgi:hypothetical protein
MEPAFASCIVALAVDVLVYDMRVIPAETGDFLCEANPRAFHEKGMAAVPQLAIPFNRPGYSITDGFDYVFVQHFAIKRGQFTMPIHYFRISVFGRIHTDILLAIYGTRYCQEATVRLTAHDK